MNEFQAGGARTGDDLIGRQIGQYTILRELGRGGMATVYLARQVSMNRHVAIKVLPREFLHDPQFIERFKREVQLVADLEHPHILPVYDFGEIDRIPFIVMRYLGGGSLLDKIVNGLPPLAELERPVQQVCSALDFAHAEGIIHRDLKPSNILLDERGNAYLSDFGIARIMQDAGRLTGSAVIGTPAYMSPEQAEGRPLDARADVYSLGVVLFEMVTGREPFQADTPMAMLLKQITEPMPSPRAYRRDLPGAVEQVILRATMKDPAARYPSAQALGDAFSRAVRGLRPDQSEARLPRPPAAEVTLVNGQDGVAKPTRAPLQADLPTLGLVADDLPTAVDRPAADDLILDDLPPSPLLTGEARAAAPTRTAPPLRPARRRASPLRWLIALLAPIALGGLAALMITRPAQLFGPGQTPPPTPFPGARIALALDGRAQATIPDGWRQESIGAAEAPGVMWFREDGGAFVAIRLAAGAAQADLTGRADGFTAAHYADGRYFTPIDRAVQPDGSLRISYRIPQPEALYGRFGPGQLDAFLRLAGADLAVVEIFTADAADAETLLPVLQSVLESVVVGDAGAAG